jgi:hypothetical protein
MIMPAGVLAQTSGTAPRGGGAFGATTDSSSSDRLDVNVSIIEALDTEAAPELRARIRQDALQSGGASSMLTAGMDYERRRRRLDVASQITTALQYYPQLDRVDALTHGAAVGATVRLPARATLDVTQTASYSPSYFYRLFPPVGQPGIGDSPVAAPDYRVDESRSFANSTLATIAKGNPRASRVSASIERQAANFQNRSERDLSTLAFRTSFAHGLGRTASVSVEYEHRAGKFGYGGDAREQRLRMGGGFSPALSTSRRAQLRASVSRALVEFDADPAAPQATLSRRYRMEAEVSGDYPFLRSWTVGGRYNRGTEYLALFREPLLRDAGRIELAGLASRRLDITASAGYVSGGSFLRPDDDRLASYTGSVRGRYALSRWMAIYGEYLYYHYDLHGQTTLAPDLPAVFEQRGLRVGLTLWARPVGR